MTENGMKVLIGSQVKYIISELANMKGDFSKRLKIKFHDELGLISKYINDLSAYYPILAHHWSMAAGENKDHKEALMKTIEYLELSGETALRSGAFNESYQFLKNAIGLYDSLPDFERNSEHCSTNLPCG